MQNIREAIHDVIERRVLPRIERDGISNLILADQITDADCTKLGLHRPPSRRCHAIEYEIHIALTGGTTYVVGDKTFLFTPGRILFSPPGTRCGPAQSTFVWLHDFNPGRPCSTLCMTAYMFGVRAQYARAIDEKDILEATPPYMLLDQYCGELLARLLEEVRFRPADCAGVGRGMLIEFMHRCLRASSAATTVDIFPHLRKKPWRGRAKSTRGDKKPSSGQIQAAREFIHFNYNTPITLDDIADAVDMSVNHLGRRFKTAIGVPPMQYLQEIRIEAARELLLTDLKVNQVANLVGIEDPCYFSRLFRRLNGASPARFRRRMAGLETGLRIPKG